MFKVDIPISKAMLAQIQAVKNIPSPAPNPTPTPTPNANPNETIAAKTGIDQSSQIRADLQNKLPVPQPAPTPTPTPVQNTSGVKDVSQMGLSEKLQIVLGKTLEHLGPEAAEKFKQLLSPENIAIMAVTTGALIAVQGVPVLDVIVDAAVLGLAAYSLGSEALSAIGDLADFASKTFNAKTEQDLDGAAQSLAKATATIGVDALAALLIHKSVKSLKGGELPPPNTRVVEMVTPEGFRIKVRIPIEEPTNTKGSNVLKIEGEETTNGATPAKTTPIEETAAKRAKLEELQRQRAEAGARQKLQEGIKEAENRPSYKRLSEVDRQWLENNPRNKELAYDPDTKSFKVGEAKAALAAEKQGILKPPVKRAIDETGSSRGGDYVDGAGKYWDVKDARDLSKIVESANKGEDVLVDGTRLSSAEMLKLQADIQKLLKPNAGEVKFIH